MVFCPILPKSKQDNRLSRETGGWRKKWTSMIPMALVFPNVYRLGMANLGFQIVYDILNRHPDIVCERVFLPEISARPLSLESRHPLTDFPFVFFSVSFEQDFPDLVRIILLSGILPMAADRASAGGVTPGNPLVVCGGVATFINPEPLAPFIDLFVVGEAEAVLPELSDWLARADKNLLADRKALLEEIAARFPGCYSPGFYQPCYNADGSLSGVEVTDNLPKRIKKVFLEDQEVAGHSRILTPEAEFSDLYLAELGRGCSRGCRFCAAGFVYRPPRLWSAGAIIKALAERPEAIKRIGLLGMEMARPDDLAAVSRYLLQESCSLSFSSLRADAIGPELITLLRKSGLKSAAIAPDGASERLRSVINKGLSEDDLLWAAEMLVGAGVMNLKLYFMIGLPTENWDDLNELVELTGKIKKIILAMGRKNKKLANILLSVNPFVPKAWTPFQYSAFAEIAAIKKKIKFIRQQCGSRANIRISVDKPENVFFQAMLAKGDRRLAEVLLELAGRSRNWQHVCRDQGIDPAWYAVRTRERDEIFPWDIIDPGVSRDYLWHEYRKGLNAETTVKCDTAKCKRCGVCNG